MQHPQGVCREQHHKKKDEESQHHAKGSEGGSTLHPDGRGGGKTTPPTSGEEEKTTPFQKMIHHHPRGKNNTTPNKNGNATPTKAPHHPKGGGWREPHHTETGKRKQHHPRGENNTTCIWTFGGFVPHVLGSRIISSLRRDASSVFTNVIGLSDSMSILFWVRFIILSSCLCSVCVYVLCAFRG